MPEIPFEQLPAALDQFMGAVEDAGLSTLRKAGFGARKAAIESAQQVFTVRNNYVARSIRYTQPSRENMFTDVSSTSKELADQEFGAVRSDGGDFRVPVAVYEVFGLDRKKVIPRQYRAKQLLARRMFRGMNFHIAQAQDGTVGVWGVPEKGRPRLLWALDPSITIERRPWFFEPIEKYVSENMARLYAESWQDEIAEFLTRL